jgi:hypothetical protein
VTSPVDLLFIGIGSLPTIGPRWAAAERQDRA